MDKFRIEIPELCLVALIGATSSGKTTFAHRYFLPTEVLSSDFFRGMVSDDENNQAATEDAFDLLYYAAEKRLRRGNLTVIDATNIQPKAREKIIELAKKHDVHTAAIVINLPEEELLRRNKARSERNYPEGVIHRHVTELKRKGRNLKREGFRFIYEINSTEQLDNVEIVRTKMWNDKRELTGPFDIIGDIHGCGDELEMLLDKLGYLKGEDGYFNPEGRMAAFVGDLCDRGNRNADVLRIVMDMVKHGNAIAVRGNHDDKLCRYLRGTKVHVGSGMNLTVTELDDRGNDFKDEVGAFLDGLISHYVLDRGKLVISHAGIRQEYIGRGSARVRAFCLYGETTGEKDEYGFPVRLNWAEDYRGRATIVYGHTAGKEVRQLNGTVCIDTGCVFGGNLTAYRYPEREIVSVPAKMVYYESVKPLDVVEVQKENDIGDMLTVGDFDHKLHIETALIPSINIAENNSAAALEIMSRFAADPHWLIYLPPTMSPCETSELEDYLEHPLQAFAYYRNNGISKVICEKKHMGSRAVIVLCRTAETAQNRFGITDGTRGIIYTRTGREFFEERDIQAELLDRLEKVLTERGFWEDFNTDWVCLDTELMPWSEKARGLILSQYAPTGNAGVNGLSAAVEVLKKASERKNIAYEVDSITSGQNVDPSELLQRYSDKLDSMERYVKAYREYCAEVKSADDLRIAPFHILACESGVFGNETHIWHMENIRKYITGADKVFIETPYIEVDITDEQSVQAGVDWWLNLTGSGGEGMVVKPEYYTERKDNRLLQPAVKCRGREYLRIIYGAEYLEAGHLERLKKRSLGRKMSLALKEFALGMEALKRFTEKEPLYRVHECVFGVLALESEPVDPRL